MPMTETAADTCQTPVHVETMACDIDHGRPHYIYGIIKHDQAGSIEGKAIIDADQPVMIVPTSGFAAIVSACDAEEIDPTRRHLLAHTRILETAMQQHTVLPVRFGTIVPDIHVLSRVLSQRNDELDAMHNRVDGMIELGLKVSWDRDRILHDVLGESSELNKLKEKISRKSPAQAYYDQIDFGRRLEDAMHEKRDQLAEDLLDHLAPLAGHVEKLKPIDDQMVLNAAFLIEQDHENDFDQAMNQLADSHTGRLDLRYVGPVPPYNFVKLSIEWQS